jgi:hypothetical protein
LHFTVPFQGVFLKLKAGGLLKQQIYQGLPEARQW